MNHGFYIKNLEIKGNSKKTVTINLTDGLNVISGVSDTGKSYIYQAIDYTLGKSDLPKEIPQAIGYDSIVLTIVHRASGKEIQIERVLGEKPSSKAYWDGNALPIRSQNEKDSLFSNLLGLMALNDKKLLRNQRGDTIDLSFRHIAHVTMIDEGNIFKECSPALTKNREAQHTTENSVIRLLLTGEDFSNIESVKQKDKDKAKITFALLEELIDNLEGKLIELKVDKENLEDQKQKLDNSIDSVANEYEEKLHELNVYNNQYQELIKTKMNQEQELEVLEVEMANFVLLRAHYNTDINRLTGLGTVVEIIDEMPIIDCPVCGASSEHQKIFMAEGDNPMLTAEATTSEIEKITTHLNDLNEIIEIKKKSRQSLCDSLCRTQQELEPIEAFINENIKQDIAKHKGYILQLTQKRDEILEALLLSEQIEDYSDRLKEAEKVKNTTNPELGSKLSSLDAAPFVKTIDELINSWWDLQKKITFSESSQDFCIDGIERAAHGQGMRAITCAAYILSLMKVCIESQMSHPTFVILDSPLVPYKSKEKLIGDIAISQSPEEELPENFSDRFYHSLKNNVPGQVIILEQKEPPKNLKINRIHFTGMKNNTYDYEREGLF